MEISVRSVFSEEEIDLTREQVARCARRALTRAIRSLENMAAKELSEELRVQLKIARSRLRSFRNRRGDAMLGGISGSLHTLPAILFGSAMKSGAGVRVGSRYFSGGFVARSRFSTKLPRRVFHRTRKARFPISEDRVDFTKEMNTAFRIVSGFAFDVFRKRFEHELRYMMKSRM